MIHCPNCGRPVGASARMCGYCGQSLVEDYFNTGKPESTTPAVGPSHIAASVLGVFSCVMVWVALLFQFLLLFEGGGIPVESMDSLWWIRTVSMAAIPAVFLTQQAVRRGARFSFWFDGVWLFLSACGLSLSVLAYMEGGAGAFYGSPAVAYMLVSGCGVACISCITGIFSVK